MGDGSWEAAVETTTREKPRDLWHLEKIIACQKSSRDLAGSHLQPRATLTCHQKGWRSREGG